MFRSRLPLSRDIQEREIRKVSGPVAERVFNEHKEFLELTDDQQLSIVDRVIACWSAIQVIAADVAPAETILRLLKSVGAPTGPGVPGIRGGHYLRSRLTGAKLSHMMGVLVV